MKPRANSFQVWGNWRPRSKGLQGSQWSQWQGWYHTRLPGSEAGAFAKTRPKCPSQEVAGGGRCQEGLVQRSALRSQAPHPSGLRSAWENSCPEGQPVLNLRLEVWEWKGAGEEGMSGMGSYRGSSSGSVMPHP